MRSIFGALIFVTQLGFSQQAELLVFNEKVHDFGNIREDAGYADTEFTFVNNSARTVSILSVQPSCGCTTPGWTKEPIGPGKSGTIKASFNPKGRPGYFNKTLTVATDLDQTPVVLQVKGQVVNEAMESDITTLTATSGSFRLKNNPLNLGKVFINKPGLPVEFKIYNAGGKPVSITSVITPPYLKVVAPATINEKETGTLQLLLDARQKSQYGFISESIELVTDDEEMPRKSFSVFASIEEYFPALSEVEKGRAPALKPIADQIDFKVVKLGTTIRRELVLQNKGKQELIIRALQPNCACMSAEVSSMKIKAGGEEKLTVDFRGEGRKGTQNKSITIYTNDPVNPVQRVTILAVVD